MAQRLLILLSLTVPAVADDLTAVLDDAKVTPIEKVIEMLQDLMAQTIDEGKAEAKTYDKFACFCKDLTKEKSEAIKAGTDEKDKLQGDLEELTSKREELDEKIAELEEQIEKLEKKIKKAEDKRAKELKLYEFNSNDMKEALAALDAAIDALKASKPSSLLEIHHIMKTIRHATLIADSLGIGGPQAMQAVTSLFQDNAETPDAVYEFHSAKIIKTLEKLKKDFKSTSDDVDKEEEKAVEEHDKLMEELTGEKKDAEEEMEKKKKKKGEVVADIATKSGDLTGISATLLDDQQYLTELAKTCNAQSETWDQRVQARADELNAITEAVSIIKGVAGGKDKKKSLTQQTISIGKALTVAASEEEMETIEADSEDVDHVVSFVQLSNPRNLLSALAHRSQSTEYNPEDKRAQVLDLLRKKGKELKSPLLSSLAMQVAKDPFVKIRKLIQELIERLLQEAADEANQKGWCDKELSKTRQSRDYKAEEIVQLNSRLASNEALRDKLTEEIDVLSKELKDLKAELEKATEMRDEEKEENETAIKEATEAKEAVEKAIKVLKDFYDKAKDNKVLMQKGPADDMPDAGFGAGEAYKGNQAASGGILGMLDVILSDFVRTIKETTKEEKAAAAEFVEFERKTKISIQTKETAKETKTEELEGETGVLAKLSDDMAALESTQELLNKAIEELQELHDACIDTGMSYAERVEMREQEIESLKEALCLLDTMGPVQTEDC